MYPSIAPRASDHHWSVLHSDDFLAQIEPLEKGRELLPWAVENYSLLKERLTRYGVLLLRDFTVDTQSFSQVADLFSPIACKQQGQISPRTQIKGTVYTSTNFPPAYPIGQHHENCYDLFPPAYIMFYCDTPPDSGGETVVVDARKLFKKLPPALVRKFEARGVKYLRTFTASSPYKTRLETFQVDDTKALQDYCKEHGIECEWVGDNLRATQVRGATTVHPETGDKAFFNVAHIWHWSSIRRAARAFGGDVAKRIEATPSDQLWGNAFYGDGSEIEAQVFEEIHGLYTQGECLIPWKKNDVVIVDNVTATHGRKPFTGDRRIQVTVRAPSPTPYFPSAEGPTRLWGAR